MTNSTKADPNSDKNNQNMTTIFYNTGRMLEADQDYERAKNIYKKVLETHPAYSDGMSLF